MKTDTFNVVRPPGAGQQAVPRSRWFLALLLGSLLFFAGLLLTHVAPAVFFGIQTEGPVLALVAIAFCGTSILAVKAGMSLAGGTGMRNWFSRDRLGPDILTGVTIALFWTALQFLIIIPATGGAGRSDIIANRVQLGGEFGGLIAMYMMAWLGGGLAEELYFRGLLVTSLRQLFGKTRGATILTVTLAAAIFALLHGYQGWIGMIDTAIFGGLGMTILFLRTKRLTAGIVSHGLYNTLAATIMFYAY